FITKALWVTVQGYNVISVEVADAIQEMGIAPLFAAIYKRYFHIDWTESSNRLAVCNMYLVGNNMWNATDASAALCQQVVDMELAKDLLNYLNDPKVDPDRLSESGNEFCHQHMLNILHNVIQKCDTAHKAYRDASAIDILPKFQSVADDETKCVVSFVLAYIVTDEENDKINEDDNNIAFVIDMLRQQPMYATLMETVPNVEFVEGLPDPASFDAKTRNLVVIDDLMAETDDKMTKLFT
ncbi:hypothetical protein LSAT2_010689, partial [Lamellibrachia satsuma]